MFLSFSIQWTCAHECIFPSCENISACAHVLIKFPCLHILVHNQIQCNIIMSTN